MPVGRFPSHPLPFRFLFPLLSTFHFLRSTFRSVALRPFRSLLPRAFRPQPSVYAVLRVLCDLHVIPVVAFLPLVKRRRESARLNATQTPQ